MIGELLINFLIRVRNACVNSTTIAYNKGLADTPIKYTTKAKSTVTCITVGFTPKRIYYEGNFTECMNLSQKHFNQLLTDLEKCNNIEAIGLSNGLIGEYYIRLMDMTDLMVFKHARTFKRTHINEFGGGY